MNKVYACIDGQTNTSAVIAGAGWAAQRLDVALEFLHVLERQPERAAMADYSGTIGLGAQDALLQELSELDERRSKLAQEAGRRLLAAARGRVAAAGLTRVDGRMRHGDLATTAMELEPDARLFVLGEHHRASKSARIHLDHHVERLIRSVHRPVLVVPGDSFTAPQRVVIAFDGSPTARKTVERVGASLLLTGLPVLVAMAGVNVPRAARGQLDQVHQFLAASGFSTATQLLDGEPEATFPALVNAPGTLLVMGAYDHSRIREFIVGSTTTTLLRKSEVPVLLLR
jgi:nucleotide-binding universal stress UspA family protein